MTKDTIYTDKLASVEAFKFDKAVAKVFPDMIERSVPGYGEIITLTGSLASMHARNNSNIYDLGCSLGASSLAMRNYITAEDCKLIAIDSAKDMVSGCQKNLAAQQSNIPFEVRQADLLDSTIENASVVVMNFILQFIPLEKRDPLLKNIFNGLQENGVLILAEKTQASTVIKQQNLKSWHEGFKKANGYSELEIAQKRSALENVLVSETEQDLIKRLENAGFAYVQKWFQAFNFKAFIAFKN